jgi:hypothetical protein
LTSPFFGFILRKEVMRMPKGGTRVILKRHADQAIYHLDHTFTALEKMFNTYYPNYPSYYEPLSQMIEFTLTLKEAVIKFKEKI